MNEHVRFGNFARRRGRDREPSFNPETIDWPQDDDRDANWDWLITVLIGMGGGVAIMLILLCWWLWTQLVGW